jgi:hypothetical protein
MILWRLLNSPANWCGFALTIAVLAAKSFGYLGSLWWLAAVLAYITGFYIGKLAFGAPQLIVTDLDALDQALSERDKPEALGQALHAVRLIASSNTGKFFSEAQARSLMTLTKSIEDLHTEWLASSRNMSVENAFVAKRLAFEYLPETVRGYLAVNPRVATTMVVTQGKTAAQLFDDSIRDLQSKVTQLQDDLAMQDAEAFANHATFLHQKFGPQDSVTQKLNAPS